MDVIEWLPFERRLCRRNPVLGEVSEGAVEAPADGAAWASTW
jgi:hypothetical protein